MLKKTIKIYSSQEKQKEDEIKYIHSISPVQRIKEAVEMISKIYENKTSSRHITIIRRG
jgi:hypothetical protein